MYIVIMIEKYVYVWHLVISLMGMVSHQTILKKLLD